MNAPLLAFVADGSREIGAGHQVRCAAIASAAVARGARVVMACRDAGASATATWAWRGLDVDVAPAELSPAMLVRRVRERHRPDAVILDHYGIDAAGVAELAADGPCALIDDSPGRAARDLRLLIDPTVGATAADHPAAPAIAGTGFAALRSAFASPPPRAPESGLAVVALGGTDPGGLSAIAAQALLAGAIKLVIAVTADAATARALTLLGERVPGRLMVRRALDATAMAALLARAEVAVVSASTLALEAAAVGTPFVAVVTADNQRRQAEGLRRAGVGLIESDDFGQLPRLVDAALRQPVPFTVDGRGADRIAERLLEIARGGAAAPRTASWADAESLLAWANDPAARACSFDARPIARDSHFAWFAQRLADPDTRILIGAAGGVDAGVVRLQRVGGEATVSIAVAPELRGRGVGRGLLDAAAGWAGANRFAGRLIAWIKPDNGASLALFRGCGFAEAGAGEQRGVPALRFTRSIA